VGSSETAENLFWLRSQPRSGDSKNYFEKKFHTPGEERYSIAPPIVPGISKCALFGGMLIEEARFTRISDVST